LGRRSREALEELVRAQLDNAVGGQASNNARSQHRQIRYKACVGVRGFRVQTASFPLPRFNERQRFIRLAQVAFFRNLCTQPLDVILGAAGREQMGESARIENLILVDDRFP